jgi:hypothetical protein
MRLQYHIQVFVAHGMYVILDYQPMDTEPQSYNVKEFICKWRTTMSRVKAIPNFWDDIQVSCAGGYQMLPLGASDHALRNP